MPSEKERRALPVFLLFTFGFSAVFYLLLASGGGGNWVDYMGCLMWCPALGAFAACAYLGRSLSTIAWRWGESRWEIACYLIPLGYAAAVYLPIWVTGVGKFYNESFLDVVSKDFGFGLPPWVSIVVYFFFTATIAVIRNGATVLGEEIGWRGFLVPELAKRKSFTATALISGVIWALWHYPILLAGPYHSSTPVWFYLPVFTTTVVAINFLWTWMRLKSGSIWPCVVLHAAHNTFFQRFFDPLTVYGENTRYVASEFGLGLTAVSILLAIYCWRRRGEVGPPSPEAKLLERECAAA